MGPRRRSGRGAPVTLAPRQLAEAGIALMLLFAPVSITGTQIGLGLAIAGALGSWRAGAPRLRTPFDAPLLAFLGVTLVSALASEAPGEALQRLAGGWIILALYLVTGWLGDLERLERFLLLLLPPAVLFGAYGIVQHFTGVNLFGSGGPMHSLVIGERLVYFPRGGFSHYQTYANVYFVIFCLACGLAAAATSARARAWRRALAGFLGVVVVFTFTRGIWLSLLAALVILSCVFARRASLIIAAAGALALAAVLLLPSSLRTRALSTADLSSNVERLLLWETAWNMIRDRPILGVGVGNYASAQDAYIREEVPLTMTRTHVHNIWLQAAVERGVLGMLALLWLLAAVVAAATRALRRALPVGGRQRAMAAASLAALIGFLIDGLVQNNLGDSQATLLFWLAAGVAVV
ncbi:MAG TPA: O-antigen ligase family protein, partial [Candidatus Methanoperedens sp.]|nr:O-antigen ligase family protein [Candidatus Methanoperedens sp.]